MKKTDTEGCSVSSSQSESLCKGRRDSGTRSDERRGLHLTVSRQMVLGVGTLWPGVETCPSLSRRQLGRDSLSRLTLGRRKFGWRPTNYLRTTYLSSTRVFKCVWSCSPLFLTTSRPVLFLLFRSTYWGVRVPIIPGVRKHDTRTSLLSQVA